MFILIDCNSFYASCERVFRPDWHHRPVIVLSNNDGCVIAMSKEAKQLGIPMGAPMHEIRHLCQTHKIVVCSSNYALYADISRRVMGIIAQLSSEKNMNMEIYSIDEAFLHCPNYEENFQNGFREFAHELHHKIWQYTGIPVSIGVAPTKTLAKMANKMAKSKHHYFVELNQEQTITQALKSTKIGDVWGIGRANLPLVQAHGVFNAHDFIQKRGDWVKSKMTIQGLRIWYELQGTACYQINTQPEPQKNRLISRSLQPEVQDYQKLSMIIGQFAHDLAEKLRENQQYCQAISVFIATNQFRGNYRQDSVLYNFSEACNHTQIIRNACLEILPKIFKYGVSYKRVGIIAHNLCKSNQSQLSLFTNHCHENDKLMISMDKLNQKFGKNTINFGAKYQTSTQKITTQNHLSPKYTTNWQEIRKIS